MDRPPAPGAVRGRPVATTHAAIESAAFILFAEKGFAGTTMNDIAVALGVGKRTLFRYYASKNDIPWGQFQGTLDRLRETLEATPIETPIHQAVEHAVLEFNRVPEGAVPAHRDRMTLLLTTPELQAHSVHQYAAWRDVIAEYVASRQGCSPDDLTPRLAGRISLSLTITAYDTWLAIPAASDADLLPLIQEAFTALRDYLHN